MRNALDGVLNRVGKVIHREDAPLGALTVVLDIADTVEHGVAHIEVAAGKINLCAQRVAPLFKFAVPHALKQVKALFNGSVAPRADGGTVGVTAVLAELLRRKLADIGKTLLYKLDSVAVGLLKIIRTVEKPVAPVKAQPMDVLLYRVDKFGVLLGGIGIVHAEVAYTAEALGSTEVNGQSLAVAYMQITVGLGRETRVDLHPVTAVPLGKILLYKCVDKVSGSFFHVLISPMLICLKYYKRLLW